MLVLDLNSSNCGLSQKSRGKRGRRSSGIGILVSSPAPSGQLMAIGFVGIWMQQKFGYIQLHHITLIQQQCLYNMLCFIELKITWLMSKTTNDPSEVFEKSSSFLNSNMMCERRCIEVHSILKRHLTQSEWRLYN
eukprot:TRINITY_DN40762_c0_g1_i6.p1 TRINITY_DN40762_c0_g1~~TRINITY_DN40762_c0_g1_i6.p1  ORF type:complete len:135 (-),score=21.52 TRINITY_DN40762_c0_g1_i6:552-956(-)